MMFFNTQKAGSDMRALAILSSSLFLSIFSFFPLAAADIRETPTEQSARYRHLKHSSSVHRQKAQMKIKNTGSVRQTIPETPDAPQNFTWKTHPLPKGNFIFTKYGINGTYPDNYP
jgi:hypothetical protein